ncbi:MAG: DUF4340 domain-containing protein [Phycisphaerales bacterium]
MSLRTVLIALIVAGVFAGLVLVSTSLTGSDSGAGEANTSIRSLGFDPAAVVEVRVESESVGEQSAFRESGAIDGWRVRLGETGGDGWAADSTRIRTVLRALSSASLSVQDDESIGELLGMLSLTDGEGVTTEVRFGSQAAGGFVPVEVVSRGGDGIAKGRWFGRIERALRDSLISEGIASWRSKELFDLTMSEVFGARVESGRDSVGLERSSRGWTIEEPWTAGADGASVQGMVGLTLGLAAERFYDPEVYTEDLTGLGSPIATIELLDADGGSHSITLGAAVNPDGTEVFAEYQVDDGASAILAIKTEGLNRLTASPLGYVRQSPIDMARADIGKLRVQSAEGDERLVVEPKLDSWTVGGTVASPSQKSAIERLVKVLTRENAGLIYVLRDGVREDGSGAADSAVGVIEITDRSGRTTRLDAGIEANSGTIKLSFTKALGDGVELVWVLESQDASGTGAWLAAMTAGD